MPEVIVIDEIGTELEAPGRPHDRRARRPAHRHGPRQQPRQPDAQPDALRPDRRDPERDPRRRGGAPPADPEERPGAQGAADLRRHRRDPGPRAGHGPRRRRRDGRRDAARRPGRARAALAGRGRRPQVAVPAAALAARAARPRPAGPRALRRARRLGRRRLAHRARLARHRRLPHDAWDPAGGARPGYRPGASGGWRESRGRTGEAGGRTLPGERIARHDERGGPSGYGARGGSRAGGPAGRARAARAARRPARRPGGPAGSRARAVDGARSSPARSPTAGRWSARQRPRPRSEARAREAREWERQAQWRDQAARALEAFKAEEGTGPANVADLDATCDGTGRRGPAPIAADLVADDERSPTGPIAAAVDDDGPALRVESGDPADAAGLPVRRQPQAPGAGRQGAPAAGHRRPPGRRGGRRHDPAQRVPPEGPDDPRGRGPGAARSTCSRPTRSSRCRPA